MQKRKRRKNSHSKGATPREALASLAAQNLVGKVEETFVWILVGNLVAKMFDEAGVGNLSTDEATLAQLLQFNQSKLARTGGQEGLWTHCLMHNRDFVRSYVAYQHLKSQDYIVKSGLQYGADFVLYSGHPSLVHSDYCVLVLSADPSEPAISWNDVEITNRLSNQVEERIVSRWVPGAQVMAKPPGVQAGQ